MKCKRCKGMMAQQLFYGRGESFKGWRCIICGDIIDEVIEENRKEQVVTFVREVIEESQIAMINWMGGD